MHTYFVTGVSGVGKSSLLHLLRERLAADRYALHDIDDRGVPPDTPESWRAEETEHYLRLAISDVHIGRELALFGTTHPDETVACPSARFAPSPRFCLLVSSGERITERLRMRFANPMYREVLFRQARIEPEAFIREMIPYQDSLRSLFEAWSYDWRTLDTSDISLKEAADQLNEWLSHAA